MTSLQNAFFSMLNALRLVCSEFVLVWQGTSSFKTPYEKLVADIIIPLPDILAQQSQSSTGITTVKKAARKMLEGLILQIANRMEAYALTAKDYPLQANVHITLSDLLRMTDLAIMGGAQKIATLATAHLANLGPYNVTAEDVEALMTASANFSGWLGKPKVAIGNKKAATVMLEDMEVEARKLLEVMDAQLVLFQTASPEFYESYSNAREQNRPAMHHRDITFMVKDVEGAPVKEVIITIPELHVEKHTGPSGSCFVAHAPAGIYPVKVFKYGYITQNIEVVVNTGESTLVEITLLAND